MRRSTNRCRCVSQPRRRTPPLGRIERSDLISPAVDGPAWRRSVSSITDNRGGGARRRPGSSAAGARPAVRWMAHGGIRGVLDHGGCGAGTPRSGLPWAARQAARIHRHRRASRWRSRWRPIAGLSGPLAAGMRCRRPGPWVHLTSRPNAKPKTVSMRANGHERTPSLLLLRPHACRGDAARGGVIVLWKHDRPS